MIIEDKFGRHLIGTTVSTLHHETLTLCEVDFTRHGEIYIIQCELLFTWSSWSPWLLNISHICLKMVTLQEKYLKKFELKHKLKNAVFPV